MDKEPKIEKNIPIPNQKRGRLGEIARKMEDGDSVFLLKHNDVLNLRLILSRIGFRVVTRKEGSGIRVWKIKK